MHSPFAYELICRAVHPGPYTWYGYADIEQAISGDSQRAVRRQARMLLRIACMLHPRSAFLPLNANNAFHAALECCDSRMLIQRKPSKALDCAMICSYGDFISLSVLKAHLKYPDRVIALRNAPRGWAAALFQALPEGLMLCGRHNVLIISRPYMRKVAYTVNI